MDCAADWRIKRASAFWAALFLVLLGMSPNLKQKRAIQFSRRAIPKQAAQSKCALFKRKIDLWTAPPTDELSS
jgi:hypothetical protein